LDQIEDVSLSLSALKGEISVEKVGTRSGVVPRFAAGEKATIVAVTDLDGICRAAGRDRDLNQREPSDLELVIQAFWACKEQGDVVAPVVILRLPYEDLCLLVNPPRIVLCHGKVLPSVGESASFSMYDCRKPCLVEVDLS